MENELAVGRTLSSPPCAGPRHRDSSDIRPPPTGLLSAPAPVLSDSDCGSDSCGRVVRFRRTHSKAVASTVFRVEGGNSLAPRPTALRIVIDSQLSAMPSLIPFRQSFGVGQRRCGGRQRGTCGYQRLLYKAVTCPRQQCTDQNLTRAIIFEACQLSSITCLSAVRDRCGPTVMARVISIQMLISSRRTPRSFIQ